MRWRFGEWGINGKRTDKNSNKIRKRLIGAGKERSNLGRKVFAVLLGQDAHITRSPISQLLRKLFQQLITPMTEKVYIDSRCDTVKRGYAK